MKRLVIRIAALGAVVVLGVIAIAQAQRGSDQPPAVGESGTSERASSGGASPPVLGPAEGSITNPLRPTGYRGTALREESPPAVVREPSANAPGNGDQSPTAGPRPDLFAARAARPGEQIGLGAPAAPRDDGSRSAAAVPGDTPIRHAAAQERYPDLPGLAPTGQATLLPPSAASPAVGGGEAPPPNRGFAAAADRYPAPPEPSNRSGARADVSDTAEPAPLKADPFAAPAAPPRPGAASPENLRLPAAAPPDFSTRSGRPAAGVGGGEPGEGLPGLEGAGRPGEKHLEGPQTPQLTMHKAAPAEVQVGKPATFRITVRNTGTVAASGVEVHDQIPKGTRVLSTSPRASRGVHGELVFTLGTIKPGDEAAVDVQLMPLTEGEIGSVATVVFNAEASARCVATRPQLVLETSVPERVLIGEQVTLSITLSNPGSGVATGVILEERIPAGLQHPAGAELEYEIGELRPGESRKLDLTLVAKQPGRTTNLLSARGDGNLRAEDRRDLEVTAPKLDVALEGPKKRYLEREATYQLSVHNPGTAAAERVELVAFLPPGLKFVSANNGGHFDEANRAVYWRLEELPINETGTVELVTLPVEAGQQSLKLLGTATKGLRAEKEQPVLIEGIAAILFQAADSVDPIEVGGETTYEIRVLNQGSKAATNVRLSVVLPPEMKAVAAEGPTPHTVEGTRVLFDGLARLAPKADTLYRVRAQGVRPGDLRTRIQLMTDEMTSPVTKEESTRVYADE